MLSWAKAWEAKQPSANKVPWANDEVLRPVQNMRSLELERNTMATRLAVAGRRAIQTDVFRHPRMS